MTGAERERLAAADAGEQPWRAWGPYLAERHWGTVREDYSEHGTAWDHFPHDHARSRAYRWGEDGLGGVCDDRQTFCFAFAFYNGVDPILKERIFGVAGPEGNHGEDAKEYWWYLDSTPTHSWMRWRYHYPQREFPYTDLVERNRARTRDEPEYELADTGVFAEDRYWAITVDYAKASPTDLCLRVTVVNHGPDPARLHVLPTLWFRNTWAWGLPGQDAVPEIRGYEGALVARHPTLGRLALASGDPTAQPLCCDNESNAERLWGLPGRSRYPKDGINDHVVDGAPTVNPDRVGTKAALHHVLDVEPGGSAEIRLRLALVPDADGDPPPGGAPSDRPLSDGPSSGPVRLDLGSGYEQVLAARRAEADEFFADLIPATATAEQAAVARQAIAGLMWGKQFYRYDVARWLDGDPGGHPPPEGRRQGRNRHWTHLDAGDVISMPDPWEYPWFAAWDLAFQCVAIAPVDPGFAKRQLLLLLGDRYLHPNGQIPAYEWAFDDVNPPVHAWAALRVFEADGGRDHEFLARVLHRLALNFTWWVNRRQIGDDHVFAGGFLGLDNVGPFDRGAPLPVAGVLAQSDGTAWMAMYGLNLMEMCVILARHDRHRYADLAAMFLSHFASIADGAYEQGLWDGEDGFFYDVLRCADGTRIPLRVRSVVGLLPLAAAATLDDATLARLPEVAERLRWLSRRKPGYADVLGQRYHDEGRPQRLLSLVTPERLVPVLSRMLDEEEFLSPYGLRSLSKRHRDEPFSVTLAGTEFTVGYEPGESWTELFGGNSNWRGPVWFPVNYLLIDSLRRYARFFGDDLLVEYPTGSGRKHTLGEVADDLSGRLVRLFCDDADGRRPAFGDDPLLQGDPRWHDLLVFHEFFHGDTGAGLGASHQTGWTALVATLILGQAARRG